MKICITGGAGYVGSELVPHLLDKGHIVTVLDLFWFGDTLPEHTNLTKIAGDIRDIQDLRRAFKGQDAIIHLACVSNDPSFDMNPELGKSINHDCFLDILTICQESHVSRFIYASSSSVYGISALDKVTEDSPKNPLTDYSRYKLACEVALQTYGMGGVWTIVRPATVCGYSRRMRLDLVVNILTIQALVKKKITVFGGTQLRPNINIKDMILAYEQILLVPEEKVDQQIFNAGDENYSLDKIAWLVNEVVGDPQVEIVNENTVDKRSYHVDSEKILSIYRPRLDVIEAIQSIRDAYKDGKLAGAMTLGKYRNIQRMKELGL